MVESLYVSGGMAGDAVLRSLITLKGLTFLPSGGIVAGPDNFIA